MMLGWLRWGDGCMLMMSAVCVLGVYGIHGVCELESVAMCVLIQKG